jgi:peptide deformylase
MTILKIARMGHPVLLRRAAAVEDPAAAPVQRLIRAMAATLADADGIGLAAPQVHESLRLILFLDGADRDDARGRRPLALINPEIEPLGEATALDWEGCLSIPGLRGVVPRFERIGYRGLDAAGRPIEREACGLHARVVQHEVDHLDGVLYPMRMPDLRRLTFESELKHWLRPVDPAPGGAPGDAEDGDG